MALYITGKCPACGMCNAAIWFDADSNGEEIKETILDFLSTGLKVRAIKTDERIELKSCKADCPTKKKLAMHTDDGKPLHMACCDCLCDYGSLNCQGCEFYHINKTAKGKKGKQMTEPTDTQIIEETLIFLRGYFRENYTGYDTLIGRDNLHEHLSRLCIDHATMTEKLVCIKRIIGE